MKFDPVEIAKMSEAGLAEFIYEQDKKIHCLQCELKQARNELCLKCGSYREAHLGACDGCRYRHGGEWEKEMDGDQE
jgi:hypothetical protein